MVEKYEDPIDTPTDGYMRLGIRSHAKGTFHSYVEKGKELETAKMFRVAANNFIVNITFGWEHAVAITDESDAGKLVSHRFPQYSFENGMIPMFFKYLILDENFKHHLELSSPGGAGRNRVLKLNDMLEYKMKFPCEDEQRKLASYFDDLDHLITLHQCKCHLLLKLLHNDWEQRKFGDLGSVAMCKRIFKEQTSTDGDIPFYKIGTFGAEPDAFISRELFEEYRGKFQYPNIGDMLISASGTIGRTVEYKGEEAYFQDSNIVWFKHDDRVDNSFLKCIYEIVKWSGIEGSTIKRLYNDNFLKTEFSMPKVAEQQQIGMYFQSLDHLITLHQQKNIYF